MNMYYGDAVNQAKINVYYAGVYQPSKNKCVLWEFCQPSKNKCVLICIPLTKQKWMYTILYSVNQVKIYVYYAGVLSTKQK